MNEDESEDDLIEFNKSTFHHLLRYKPLFLYQKKKCKGCSTN